MSRLLRPFLLVALFLSACAGPTLAPGRFLPERASVRDFSLDARFSLTQEPQRHAGRLSWRHVGGRDEMLLASPFGQGVAEIILDLGVAQLHAADGRRFEASDVEALTHEVLGYRLPLAGLAAWVLGRGERLHAGLDASGRPVHAEVDGWQIDYAYDDESPGALPARLDIRREGGPEIRLRIEEWRVP